MATLLSSLFREKMKETKDIAQTTEMTYSVSYPTGILPLDYVTSYLQEIDGKRYFEFGFTDGSINTLIGASGVGKTSLLTTMACNMVKPFKTSCIFFDQIEVGTNVQRIKNLSGFGDNDRFSGRFIIRDAGITVESIYKRIMNIHNIKINNKDKFMYDTGLHDMRGNKILKFEPTIYIIDSLKVLKSEKSVEVEETNNMSGATNAKAMTEYFSLMMPMCRISNIIIILVNHIAQRIQTGSFPKKSEFPFLAQDEHLPNAGLLNYISNIMFRLDINRKLDPDKEYGIHGTTVNVDMVKSRINNTGKSRCTLVYNQDTGFDADLSLFEFMKSNNLFEGSGAYLRVPGCDIKFSQRKFKEMLYTNPELFKAVNVFCLNYIRNMMVEKFNKIKEENNRTGSVYDSIMSEFAKLNGEDINAPLCNIPEGDKKDKIDNIMDLASDSSTESIVDSSEYDSN